MASVEGVLKGWLFDCVEREMPNSICRPSGPLNAGLGFLLVQFCSPMGPLGVI